MSGRRKVSASGSALIDPDAKAKLEQAAAAVGLSVTQLVDLVADSGALTLPPAKTTAGAAPVLSLKELGARLMLELQEVHNSERAHFFSKLLQPQQVALVVSLRAHGFRSEIIGKDLGIHPLEVTRLYNEHADNLGASVVNLRLNTIAGQMQLAAERAQEGLMQDGDWKGYWKVQSDFLKALQSLGIIDTAAKRIAVEHKVEFVGQKQAEVDALMELERKKQRRLEEIKTADARLVETVPASVTLEGEGEIK